MSEGLRNRKDPSKDKEEPATKAEFLMMAAHKAPESLRPVLTAAAPIAARAWEGFEQSLPLLQKAYTHLRETHKKLKKYDVDSLLPCLIGICMAFFGGEFPLLIATVVAFKATGSWSTIRNSTLAIVSEAEKAWYQSLEDDKKDDDGNGVPDTQEISATDLARRKALIIAESIDPEKISAAASGLASGVLAVIASLKLSLARTITLGSSIGDVLTTPVTRYAAPVIKAQVSDYKQLEKWVDPFLAYSCRFGAMSMALVLSGFISSVHSAIKGGQMFSKALFRYLNKHKFVQIDTEATNLDEMAGYGVAVVGLFYQLFYTTPMLLTIVLLPFTFLEWLIKLVISFV